MGKVLAVSSDGFMGTFIIFWKTSFSWYIFNNGVIIFFGEIKETATLMARQEQMKDEVENLKKEREMLLSMLRFHDASPAARCGRTLSQSDEKWWQ